MTSRIKIQFFAAFLLKSIFFNVNSQAQPQILSVDFESNKLGEYKQESIAKDWPGLNWEHLYGRGEIVDEAENSHGKVLQIFYPKGGVGPGEGGGQFEVKLPPTDEYWLSYDVKFVDGFDFRKGGKLPGLTSGGGKYTGGVHPGNGEGWSARYMWRREGKAVIYFYWVENQGDWGMDLELNGEKFQPGTWHRLTQHIKINSPEKADGFMEVWFDGRKSLVKNDIRFRIGDQGRIDSIYFSTFHGGNSKDWGPRVDCFVQFDNFVLSTTALEH